MKGQDTTQLVYKYRVVIADDEPMAVKAIERILEKNCPDYVTVGTAVNGRQALELIRETTPDLVLTDITMPIMDGLELARIVSEEDPDICFVVISGYQDFEYMRRAIQNGVLDYLAKPIVPSQITAMMDRVREKLRSRFYNKRNALLRAVCLGEDIKKEDIEKHFPCRKYYAALFRENGLPRRFYPGGEPELFSDIDEAYSVYGRDSREELFLIPEPLLTGQPIGQYMEKVSLRQRSADSYTTLLYYSNSFPPDQLVNKVRGLYRRLSELTVIGRTQCIDAEAIDSVMEKRANPGDEDLKALLRELDIYANTRRCDPMIQKINKAFLVWGQEGRSQLWMEHAARRILNYIHREDSGERSILEREYDLEDAFYYATSVEMLCSNMQNIFFYCHFSEEQREKPKVDSQEFFDSVSRYLTDHLSEPLSLQHLCDVFAISQAYMSKLFRKYADQSYAQYLTRLRMDKAMELMKENKELFVKDIAVMVGYQDQFYFSRIFRSFAGMSPADYMKLC